MASGLQASAFLFGKTKDFCVNKNSMVSSTREGRKGELSRRLRKMTKCLCSGEQLRRVDEVVPSSESLATKDYSASGCSSRAGPVEKKPDTGNIEEAESSLRESDFLNYEEARALLGRYEYKKGNIRAALRVFEGIDMGSVSQNMKITLAKRVERSNRSSQNFDTRPISIHAVALLLEASLLKAKCLQVLERFKEAAQSCKVILDIVESSLPNGLPENFGAECRLQETLSKAVELLPELWKLADCPREAILSYRRALLHHWNLDAETTAKIQKEFAVFLLYSGWEAEPPNLRSQMDSSFVPGNNIEEVILLLMILLRKVSLNRIEWDPSILDHLSFALSVSGDLITLAHRWEELLPGVIDRKEMYHILALCYYGAGKDLVALDLVRKLLSGREDPRHVKAMLMASKICCENPHLAGEGVSFAHRVLKNLDGGCDQLQDLANCLLGVALSAHSKSAVSDSERSRRKSEALHAFEIVGRMKDPIIPYYLSLQYAEQREWDDAFHYAKCFLKLESGSIVKGWLLLARILSAQKRFSDAESIIDAALDQTGKWDQGDLLRTKAKLQIAQDQLRSAIETYTQLLAILQIQSKSFGSVNKPYKVSRDHARDLEVEIWHDLAYVYIGLSQWHDAEVCLAKSKAIKLYSANRCHVTGKLSEARGLDKEAVEAFHYALGVDPDHVPSLMSTAVILTRCNDKSSAIGRSFLMGALRLDRMNASACYNLGLLYKAEGLVAEAAECFQAAYTLQESLPIEPFR